MIKGTPENVVKLCKYLELRANIPGVWVIWNESIDLRDIIEWALKNMVKSGFLTED